MMLCNDNKPLQAAVAARFHDLVGIEVGRIEFVGAFAAISPFAISERIDAEMHNANHIDA